MSFRKHIKAASIALALSCLISSAAAADGTEASFEGSIEKKKVNAAFQNDVALDNDLDTSRIYSEENSDYSEDVYYSFSTLDYLKTIIQSMSTNNIYRLALENAYGDSESVENITNSSKSIWSVMGAAGATTDSSYLSSSDYSGNTTYASIDSTNKVYIALKKVLGDAGNTLSSGMTPDSMWSALCNMSEASGNGGEYTWEDTVYNGGSQNVEIGDQVYFSISAYYGSKSVPASYTEHRTTYYNRYASYPTTSYNTYVNDEIKNGVKVVAGNRITFVYCGLVVDVGENGVRAVCGDIDLSGLGNTNKASIERDVSNLLDASGNPISNFGQGSSSVSTDSSGKTAFKINGEVEPVWGIEITSRFCHNTIDYDNLMRSMYSTYILPDTNTLLEFDINREDLGAYLAEQIGNTQFGQYLASKLKSLYIATMMEAQYGVTTAETTAWLDILLSKNGGDMTAEGIAGQLPEEKQQKYEEWLAARGEDKNTESIIRFINEDITTDDELMTNIRLEAMVMSGNGDEDVCMNVKNILKWYFGDNATDPYEVVTGNMYLTNSMESAVFSFIKDLSTGEVNLDYKYSGGTGGSGGQAYIDPNSLPIYITPVGIDPEVSAKPAYIEIRRVD